MKDSFGRTPEEREALRQKIEKLNAEALENWDDPAWRRMMAQEIQETILEGFTHENLLNLMTTVETVGETGRIFVKETRGLQAFWIAKGGSIEASRLNTDVREMDRDTIGFRVYEFEDKIRNGFGETQASLVDLGIERLSAEVNLRMLRLFQAAIPNSSPYYISGSGVSLTALDTALNEVFDETRDGAVTIVGRRTMIGQVADALSAGPYGGFLPETNEEILRTGVIGTYKGARFVQLTNYKDDQDVSFFPANEMYVLGRDASKAGFWGGLLSREWTDENWYWNYAARRDFGAMVHRPERLRRIVDTSIAP